MDFPNINDPAAVRALLDQLKASRIWQDTLNLGSSRDSSEQGAESHESLIRALEGGKGESKVAQPSDTATSASVASLLSQLRTSTAIDTPSSSHTCAAHPLSRNIPQISQDLPSTDLKHQTSRPVAATPSTDAQDTRSMPFQQALPHLTELAHDPEFLAAVSRLRQEQDVLEQQLWEERQVIRGKHEEKVKVARTRAALIGAGLSKHEADMMNDAYHKDLQKFDKERALLAWDALIQKQQEALEALGVPTMFATTSQADCQKQRRVAQVLEGL